MITQSLWFIALVGGPRLLAAALLFALTRQRRLNPAEQEESRKKTEELYRD